MNKTARTKNLRSLGGVVVVLAIVVAGYGCSSTTSIPKGQSPLHPLGVGKIHSASDAQMVAKHQMEKSNGKIKCLK